MKGGTRKRGSTWSYYFDLGKVNGKRKKKEKGGFRTKKEAQKALIHAIDEYNHAGMVFEPSEITVSDYLDQWYELYCKVNLKYNTQVAYLRIIEKHLRPTFGSYKLKTITAAHLQKYANKLATTYSKNHMTGILTVFQSALDYAIEPLGYIKQNPMKMVRIPKIEKKQRERIILSMEQWNTMIHRFENTRFYLPLMIGFYTGLRISETFALTWDDIDFEQRTLSVNKQVIKRNFGANVKKAVEKKQEKVKKSSWYFTTPKTASSIRTISFGDTLYEALKKEKAAQRRNELECGEDYTIYIEKKETDEKGNEMIKLVPIKKKDVASANKRIRLICINKNGSYTSTDSFKFCSRVIHKELNINFDYHSLRHTHATLLIESGANVKNVQARLGHSNIQTTLQTYVHNTSRMEEQSVQLFEEITGGNSVAK